MVAQLVEFVFQRRCYHIFFLREALGQSRSSHFFLSFIITALFFNKTQRKLLLNRTSDKAERWRAHHTKRQIAVVMIIT